MVIALVFLGGVRKRDNIPPCSIFFVCWYLCNYRKHLNVNFCSSIDVSFGATNSMLSAGAGAGMHITSSHHHLLRIAAGGSSQHPVLISPCFEPVRRGHAHDPATPCMQLAALRAVMQ